MMDDEHCYRVASSRDGRFDGAFVTAVLTTGIYCRPSCPAMTPKRQNVRFYPTPAAAQTAGFRACKRCRPDAAPGSPEWDARADVVARAMRLIGDGVVEREGISGLARRLGYSPRHLHRLLDSELGTGPLRLALAHRVQNARALLENSELSITVAWASGFGSIRQFNDRIREVYALSPTEIRHRAIRDRRVAGSRNDLPRLGNPPTDSDGRPNVVGPDAIWAHLPYRPPLDMGALLGYLGRRAIPGVESYDGKTYSRVLRLPHGLGVIHIPPTRFDDFEAPEAVHTRDQRGPTGRGSRRESRPSIDCALELDDVRDYATAISRIRRLLDLDADPGAVDEAFSGDALLGGLAAANPGIRVPGSPDPEELAVRAVLGQQVSLRTARTLAADLARFFGQELERPRVGLTHAFPTPEAIAAASPTELPMPRARATALIGLAEALSGGAIGLDPGADRDEAERSLLAIDGIGPWTAAYIRMRGLGDPDVFLPTDLAIRRALAAQPKEQLGLVDPSRWKPWRSYAVMHLLAPTRPDHGPDLSTGPT